MSTVSEVRTRTPGVSLTRSRVYGILFLLVAIVIVVLFAVPTEADAETTFTFNPVFAGEGVFLLPDLTFPTQIALYALAVVTAFAGGVQLARAFERANLMLLIVVVVFVIAFLAWAAAGAQLNLTVLLSSTLLRATPIALAALSGVLCERAAVINIAIEGMMLTGAFVAALFGSLASNIWGWADFPALLVGLLAAIVAGALLGLLLAVLAVRYKVDQIIAGTAINILATGLTSFLSSQVLQSFDGLNNTPVFNRLPIPLLSRIPILGPILFEQTLLVYLMFVLLAAVHIMLFYTRFGLRTRAVGEHPRAADTLGVDVYRIRYINVTLGGVVAGIAGAFLVLASVGRFDEVMTAGRGFIGLAAMIFGNWMPFGAFGAALIFGFAESLQTRLAILSVPIPSQFLLMAPYLITIIVLAGVIGEAHPPAADGEPYEKQ